MSDDDDPVGDWLANELGPKWTVIVDPDADGWDVAVIRDHSPLVHGGYLNRDDAEQAHEFAAGLVAHVKAAGA